MSSEPVFFVKVVTKGGDEARVDLSNRVTSFTYEDDESKADRLMLSVDNWDLSNWDDPVWKQGNFLEVSWGYPGVMAPPRTVEIKKVSGFQVLKVECHGREIVANNEVRCRVFENMKRSDVVRQVAAGLGFVDDDVLHIEDTQVVHETIAQARLTDAQFLRRLAHKEGFEWFVDFDGFHFHQRDLTQRPVRALVWFNTPADGVGKILNIETDNDHSGRHGKVKAVGRDPENKEDVGAEASNDTETERAVLAAIQEFGDQTFLGGPFGIPATGSVMVRPTTEESNQGAKRDAKGKFRREQQQAVKLKIKVVGDPTILAKTVIELVNASKRLSQRYYLTKVTHTIGTSGYTAALSAISDGTGGHSTRSERASELSQIRVGEEAKGKRGPEIDEEALKKAADIEAGNQVAKLVAHDLGVADNTFLNGPFGFNPTSRTTYLQTGGRRPPPKEQE